MEEKVTNPGQGKQALYRRYRSTSFDELVGQEHVTELLKAAVNNGTFSHAYLFTGQRGTGKTSAARLLAHAINNLPYSSNTPHLDIIEIDAASNRRIDDIRDLREKVFIAPVAAKYKVYIIDEVHMLTGESFNALLKTLEEPPQHVIFILATTELHKVPATIVSRTQRFHFRPIAQKKVIAHLRMLADKESIDIDDEALELVAEHGGGSFRDSISLLDQLGSLGSAVTAETVEHILGRARSADIRTALHLLETGDQVNLHALLNDVLANGTSPVTFAEQLVGELLSVPHTEERWYHVAEKLMSVAKAHFPQLLLTSTLLGFVSKPGEKLSNNDEAGTVPKPAVKPRGNAHESRSDTTPAPSHTPSETTITATDQTPQKGVTPEPLLETSSPSIAPETKSPKKSGAKGTFDWDTVLTGLKKTNPALHAVLSRASANFTDNTLSLSFHYGLHRKKLEQPQYRTQLSRAIQDICGLNPDIVITGSTPELAGDDTTKRVAELMGGGESVNV